MTETIRNLTERCKEVVGDDYVFTLILLSVMAVAAFGLGRWSVLAGLDNTPTRPVLVTTPVSDVSASATSATPAITSDTAPTATNAGAPPSGNFVASINGTKFHKLTCASANRISVKNKIYFQTEEEARAAGYTRAANCRF